MRDPIEPKIRAGNVYVFDVDALIAGVIAFAAAGDALAIDIIAVPPRLQGMGIGTKLLRFAEASARARGCTELRLFTNAAMTESLAWYARLGFERTREGIEDGYRRVYLRFALPSERPIA